MVKGKRRTSKGTSIRYSIDRTASLLIYIQEKRRGRWITVKVIAIRNARAGSHSMRYNARQGKKLLPAGSCRVIAAAADHAGWSSARSTSFSVFQKKAKQHKPTHHGR